jgi:hypothetical protein
VNPVQFAQDIRDTAQRAAAIVAENRDRFCDIRSTAACLLAQKPRRGYFWDDFHAAIAAGLAGDVTASRRRFASVLAEDPVAPWMSEAQQTARDLTALAADTAAFRRWAAEAVADGRDRLRLPPRTVSFGDV